MNVGTPGGWPWTPTGSDFVTTGKFKEGSSIEDATTWWREKGGPDLVSEPWTKSLRVFATQFRLGGEHDLEVWQEIENYAVLDEMDEWYAADPVRTGTKEDLWRESSACIEWGASRLMGDWPESSLME